MSRCLDLMNAVVAKIDAGTFAETFTPTAAFDLEIELKSLDSLRVVVVPNKFEGEFASRNSRDRNIVIDVGVLAKLDDATNAEADRYVSLIEAIDDWLTDDANRILTVTGGKYVLSKAETDPIVDPELIRDSLVFASVVTVTYKRTL